MRDFISRVNPAEDLEKRKAYVFLFEKESVVTAWIASIKSHLNKQKYMYASLKLICKFRLFENFSLSHLRIYIAVQL